MICQLVTSHGALQKDFVIILSVAICDLKSFQKKMLFKVACELL
jgi:hypothetical protein